MAVAYEPIKCVGTLDGQGFPSMDRGLEKASQTFNLGVPLELDGGYLQEIDFGDADSVHGVSAEPAHNLASSGVATENYEALAQNQPAGKIVPVGAWVRDGYVGFYRADGRSVFSAMLKDGQVFTQAMVGVTYGITKDGSTGYWYIDNTDTSGDNLVAVIRGLDDTSPNTVAGGARVFFQFLSTLRDFK